VSQFVRGSGLSDDATCLVVKIAPKETARYQLTTTLDQMGTVRSHIHAFCASLPDAEEVILRVQLGVVETLTNVIKHAFKFEEDHVVELTMETYSDRVCVRLDYDGPFFEPDVASLPNPKDMVESGYGLYIVEQCFDQVEYFVAEDRRSAVLMTRTFCVK
jgi:anti-sigma regulatory factor (Ser/Thr protein kinase)